MWRRTHCNNSVSISSQRSDAEESPASVYETDEEESDTVSIYDTLDTCSLSLLPFPASRSCFVLLKILFPFPFLGLQSNIRDTARKFTKLQSWSNDPGHFAFLLTSDLCFHLHLPAHNTMLLGFFSCNLIIFLFGNVKNDVSLQKTLSLGGY